MMIPKLQSRYSAQGLKNNAGSQADAADRQGKPQARHANALGKTPGNQGLTNQLGMKSEHSIRSLENHQLKAAQQRCSVGKEV